MESVVQNQMADPEIQGLVLTSHDVTERKRAEHELRESEEQYRLIFDGNPNPMWVSDHETLGFLEVNDAAVQHYGYSREEFLKMTLQDLRPAGDDPAPLEYIHNLLAELALEQARVGGRVASTQEGRLDNLRGGEVGACELPRQERLSQPC